MGKALKVGVVIGRFQPLHNGHMALIKRALKASDILLVLIGSARVCFSSRNPFSYGVREAMVNQALKEIIVDKAYKDRVIYIMPLDDKLYNDFDWRLDVLQAVVEATRGLKSPKITLYAASQDKNTKEFDGFSAFSKEIYYGKEVNKPTGSEIRAAVYNGKLKTIKSMVPAGTYNALQEATKFLPKWPVALDYKYEQKYRADTQKGMFPTLFQTVDNIIINNGKVLMIERGGHPCIGTYAFPGGFVNENEKLMDAAIREAKEETGIIIDPHFCAGSRAFDDPNRDGRGRIITQAYIWIVSGKQPKVKAADDAVGYQWFDIADMMDKSFDRGLISADHYDILYSFFVDHRYRKLFVP